MMTHINTMMEIQDDELITSWLEVLAANNDFTVREFFVDFKKIDARYRVLFRKDYLRNLEHYCKAYDLRGFPKPIDVMKKHTGYYADVPFREKWHNILMSESMLRDYSSEGCDKRIFSDIRIKEEIKNYLVCPECMREDIKKCYRPYVHVWHNLPGVTCCQKHGCRLVELDLDNYEIIAADEKEMTIARFMYQMYINPFYGNLEQTYSIVKNRNQNIIINSKIEIKDIIDIVTEMFTYEEFVSLYVEQMNYDYSKMRTIVVERKCKSCGCIYNISLDAESVGFDCPECDKNKDTFAIYERIIDCCGDHEFELLETFSNKRVSIKHKPCGRYRNYSILEVFKKGLSCYRCSIDREGEKNIAKNGQQMTIIRYRNYHDIDIEFSDGTIVKNKTYVGFLKGETVNPNCKLEFSNPNPPLKNRVGETTFNKNGYRMTIIRYGHAKDIDVEFDDGTISKSKAYTAFCKGQIRKPNC